MTTHTPGLPIGVIDNADIGAMLYLTRPVPDGTPMDEPWFTRVQMEGGAGSWPHFHAVGDRPVQREAEFFQWVQGDMEVYLRASEKWPEFRAKGWTGQPLDNDHPFVFVPPGWDHAIIMTGLEGKAEFVAFTPAAHLVNNEKGGNVHRINELDDLPQSIVKRINADLIK